MRTLLFVCLFILLAFLPFTGKAGGRYEVKAEVAKGDIIEVQRYDVDMTVLTSRKVEVKEQITVRFLKEEVGGDEITMFYRSLPTSGVRYENFQATCEGNPDFTYDVIDNPDMSGFIDVECIGGVKEGQSWTYDISYVMEPTSKFGKDEMIIDIIGYGWSVDLHNVTATVHLPSPTVTLKAYEGGYGDMETEGYTLSQDGKTVQFTRSVLAKVYNDTYDESMAAGITLSFALEKGVLQSYAKNSIFTEDIGKLLIWAGLCVALAVVLRLIKSRRALVVGVHIKPPEGMSPMLMGKLIDGSVNGEDSTSMLYYFAHKGYIKINMEDEEDPELIRLVPALPEDAPAHEKTLFDGLFDKKGDSQGRVKISKLVGKYYEATETAKEQLLTPKPMYEKGSIFRFALGYIIGIAFAFIATAMMGDKIGGGYFYPWGIFLALPLVVHLGIAVVRENNRYKWKSKKSVTLWCVGAGICLLAGLLYTLCFAEFFMTEWEKLVVCLGSLLPAFFTSGALNRGEEYAKTLEEVLGFKEFIVTTEEDKIEVMLQENPELYFEVLPYAQVLGVTDEWIKKFERLTIPVPAWCVGNFSYFDYWLMYRCVYRSMQRGMMEAAMKSSGGGHIGRSGGGGGFGGFGGGGFGGGGGGAR